MSEPRDRRPEAPRGELPPVSLSAQPTRGRRRQGEACFRSLRMLLAGVLLGIPVGLSGGAAQPAARRLRRQGLRRRHRPTGGPRTLAFDRCRPTHRRPCARTRYAGAGGRRPSRRHRQPEDAARAAVAATTQRRSWEA